MKKQYRAIFIFYPDYPAISKWFYFTFEKAPDFGGDMPGCYNLAAGEAKKR